MKNEDISTLSMQWHYHYFGVNNDQTAPMSHASKVMLKILQARLQQYMNHELPDVQAGFRKGRGTRDQIANIRWIIKKAREFQKNIYFCFIEYDKAFDSVDHNKLWKILKEMGIPDHVTCLLRNLYAGHEATVRTGNGTTDWFQIGKRVCQGYILLPCLFNLNAEYIMRNAGVEVAEAGNKIVRRIINNLRYADDTTLMAESEEIKSLLMKVKEESEKVGLKLNIEKTKSWHLSHHFMANRWEIVETVVDFILLGSKVTADGDCSHEVKRHLLLWRKVMTKLDQHIKKQRHYFANKGPSSQGYRFSSDHVWMWELDCKESWALKNWCFWTVVLEKTLESPLDCKEIQPVHPKGHQSWVSIGGTDAEAETPILWPPDAESWLTWKDPDAGKDWRQEEKGTTEDEMVGWHHRLNGHEFW